MDILTWNDTRSHVRQFKWIRFDIYTRLKKEVGFCSLISMVPINGLKILIRSTTSAFVINLEWLLRFQYGRINIFFNQNNIHPYSCDP